MVGSWFKSTPACGTNGNIKDMLTEEVIKQLNSKCNSSGLRPGLAGTHNDFEEKTGKSILSLPISLLVQISGHAVVDKTSIIVSLTEPRLCQEPALLQVSKAIRAVARPVFYSETMFRCEVSQFNVMSLQPWVRKREAAMQTTLNLDQTIRIKDNAFAEASAAQSRYFKRALTSQDNIVKTRTATKQAEPTPLFWDTDEQPNWTNLVDWLELYHHDTIGPYQSTGVDPVHHILISIFGVVRVLRTQSWDLVEAVLREARLSLVAVNPVWEEEQDGGFEMVEEDDPDGHEGGDENGDVGPGTVQNHGQGEDTASEYSDL